MHSFLYRNLISRMPDRMVEKLGGPYYRVASWFTGSSPEIPVSVDGMRFANPVGMPAGWIDSPRKLKTVSQLGGGILTIKTITRYPKAGNPYPRIVRRDQGIVNSLGLPNLGADWWAQNFAPPADPVIVSIKGDTLQDWEYLIEKLEFKTPIFELNISCPNVGDGVMDLDSSRKLVEDITSITDRQIYLKLSPEYSPEQNLALIDRVRSSITGVTAINTQPVSAPQLGNPAKRGGFSGPGLFPTLESHLQIYRAEYPTMIDLPIFATGGISTPDQAWRILENYRSLPMGLTAFLVNGPRVYLSWLNYIESQLEGRSVNEILEV
ncbi:MAG: dihydroorotate dehydrogenase [Candidatus Kariarchaeaceae archaeon]